MMIADTDVLIDYLRGARPVAERVALEIRSAQLATTTVTRFELGAGARSARQRKIVTELLDALPCLPLDREAADRAAEVRHSLERRGLAIGMADSLIAGITLESRGILLTRNRRHFERVEGLALARIERPPAR